MADTPDDDGPIKRIETEIELQGKLEELYRRELDLRTQKENVELRIRELSGEQLKQSELIERQAEIRIQAAEKVREVVNKSNDEIKRDIIYLNSLGDKRTAQQEEQLKLLADALVLTRDQKKEIKEALDLEEAAMAQLKKRTQLAGNLSKEMGGLLGVTEDWKNTTEGQILQLATMQGSVSSLTLAMREQFSLANIGGSLITKVTEATVLLLKEQDAAIASFKQATGAGDAYNDIIIDSHINLRTYGVSSAQAAKATGDLFTHMSGFSEMNKQAQMSLVQTTALLDRFGVSSTEAAKSLDFLTKGLKMSSEQAISTTQNLVALGQGLNVPPEIIFSQFSQASKQLASHGGDMVKVFKGLAAAAKASGAEMSTLLGYAGQFDVFSTGATAVGKLNALLGGPYLNTVQMLNASEEERIGLTLKALEASGKQFSSLSKFEQISIANAAGIKDMAEANKLLGMSSLEYEVMQSRAESAAMSEEEFKKVTQDAMSVVEKFTTIAKNFAVNLAFLLKPLGWVADKILELQEWMGEWFGLFALGTGIIVFFTGKILGLGAALGGVVKTGLAALGKGIEAVGISAGKAGTSATAGALGLLAFGFAMLMVGGGVWLATTGIVNLIEALGELTGEQLQAVVPLLLSMTLAFGVLAAGLVLIAAIGSAAILPLLAVGAAFLMIGAGIWMATEGMASLASSLGQNADGIEKVLASASLLIPLIATLGAVSVSAGLGMLMLGAGFAALAAGLWLLPLDKLKAMADIVNFIKEAKSAFSGGGAGAGPGGAGGSPFGNTIQAINNLDPDKVQLAEQVAATATSYNMSAKATTTANMESTNGILKQILAQLKKAPEDQAGAIAATLGDIKIMQNDVMVGQAQNRTSLDIRRSRPGAVAEISG